MAEAITTIMQHYRSLEEVTLQNSWLTVGVFDGVHRGHQQIINILTAGAHATSAPAVLLTFDPHPAKVFGREDIKLLTLPEEQAEPEDSATPSRSKFISRVSADMPG